MYGLLGKFVAQPGARDALAAALRDAAELLRAVDGCLIYLVSLDGEDPQGIWVHEVWEDQEAHGASLGLDAVQQLIKTARPLIADMTDRHELQPLGGVGLQP